MSLIQSLSLKSTASCTGSARAEDKLLRSKHLNLLGRRIGKLVHLETLDTPVKSRR